MKHQLCQSLSLLIPLAIAADCFGQEWTRFRGPNGTGISSTKTIPTRWTEKDFDWKAELPGLGHSSPVVWGERVFVTGAEESGSGGLHVLCLSAANGRKLWQRDFPLPPFQKNRFNSFASATPTVDAERVYVAWCIPQRYTLMALDHAGQTVWERDLGPFVNHNGCGSSPIVYEDRLILANEQEQEGVSSLIAVDAGTGKTRWQTRRQNCVPGMVPYATPCIFQSEDGKPVVIFNSKTHGVSALDPDDGAVVWEFEQVFDNRCVSSPYVGAGLVFGSCGSGGGGSYVAAIRPGDGKTSKSALAYEIRKSAPFAPTGLVVGDFLYLWNDLGVVTCAKAATGEVRWQERAGGNFFGSPICVDGRLFCVSAEGEVVVVQATPDYFKELSRFPLGETSRATPAVSGGRMFIRTEQHLFCIGAKKSFEAHGLSQK